MTTSSTTAATTRIRPRTLREELARNGDITIVDVRGPAEFDTVHVEGAVNVPLPLLEQHTRALAAALDRPVVLVCQSGVRAAQAQQRLLGVGVEQTRVLDGGLAAYTAEGGDVVRGRPRWALERQVRLVAGLLVSVGLLLGLRLPKARLLAAGIGAGLTFSALTDTCAMGRVLSKLPYNSGVTAPVLPEVLARLDPDSRAT